MSHRRGFGFRCGSLFGRVAGSRTGLIVLALLASAAGTVFEPLLFRGFFDLARHLKLTGQRIGAITAMICFLAGCWRWSGPR